MLILNVSKKIYSFSVLKTDLDFDTIIYKLIVYNNSGMLYNKL